MHAAKRWTVAGALVSTICAGLFLAGGMQSSVAEDLALPMGFQATPLLKGGQTASGIKLQYPQTDKAEIVSVIGVLEPGGRTALHQHPVPVFVYILEGTLTVKSEGGEPRVYTAGQAFLEDINHTHQGFNETGEPAKILVVFMGEEGKPTTVAVQ